MIIYHVICARPERDRHAWTALEYGLVLSCLAAIVAIGIAGSF